MKELNAIVHPAVIEAQRAVDDQVFARDPAAVAVVVSALIFEVERDARASGEANAVFTDLRKRIDRVVLVTAPDDAKIARYVARSLPPASRPRGSRGRRAFAACSPDPGQREEATRADYVLENTGDIDALRAKVGELWPRLKQESNLNLKK